MPARTSEDNDRVTDAVQAVGEAIGFLQMLFSRTGSDPSDLLDPRVLLSRINRLDAAYSAIEKALADAGYDL